MFMFESKHKQHLMFDSRHKQHLYVIKNAVYVRFKTSIRYINAFIRSIQRHKCMFIRLNQNINACLCFESNV